MDPLLYSSKEMFSSIELEQNTQEVYDKLSNKDIDKAIILNDGKPSHIMLDFDTYELIMRDYIRLIQHENSASSDLSINDIKVQESNRVLKKKEPIEEEIEPLEQETQEESDEEVVDDYNDSADDFFEERIEDVQEENEEVETIEEDNSILDEEVGEELDEYQQALAAIDSLPIAEPKKEPEVSEENKPSARESRIKSRRDRLDKQQHLDDFWN